MAKDSKLSIAEFETNKSRFAECWRDKIANYLKESESWLKKR